MKPMLATVALLALLSCSNEKAAEPNADCVEKFNPAISCITLYDPVCGCNGKTYGNDCMATAAGIRVVSKGECPAKGK
jgi:hypothetical protein